jgi:hypothetical protein
VRTKEQRNQAANDLLTVVVSFVLYMTMLLVLVAVQGQQEAGEPPLPHGWALQHLLALFLLILGAGHLVGAKVIREQQRLRLLLTAAEVMSAGSLFLLAPGGWVWLVFAAVAFGGWAFCFQVAVLEFMEQPEEEGGQEPVRGQAESAAATPIGLPGETRAAPRAESGSPPADEFDDSQLHV